MSLKMTELIRNQKQKKQWEIAQKMEIPQHIPKLKKKKRYLENTVK